MSATLYIMLAFISGLALGALFFGGLWFTVKKGLTSKMPGIWFILSFFIRTGLTLGGFYMIAQGSWQRLLVCLLGFIVARLIVKRFLPAEKTRGKEVAHEA